VIHFSGEDPSFWGRILREVRGRPAQDLDLLLQHPVAPSERDQLVLLSGGRALDDAVVDVSLLEPTLDRVLRDPEVVGDLGVGQARGAATATTSRLNSGG
jgi:hypothetical protein